MEIIKDSVRRKEIVDTYFGYFEAYARRDWDAMVSYFDGNFTMVGTGVDEKTHQLEETLATMKREFAQAPAPITYETKNLEVFEIGDDVAVLMISMDVCLHNIEGIVECPNNRSTVILRQTDTGWKLVHGHWSQPDRDIDVGESVPYRLLKKRSLELEEKVAERTREIEAQKERLEKLNRTKNKLFSVIGHDLRAPFNSLLGFSRMLVDDYDTFTQEEVAEFIRTINKQAGKAYGLLDNLLHWAKSQDDKISFNPVKIQMHKLVEEVSSFLKVIADEKEVTVKNLIAGNLHVVGDNLMLQIILRNLLHNAIKYSQSGDRVVVSASVTADRAEIIVSDHGVGMDKKCLEALQESAMDMSMRGTGKEQGTGLGLVLTREFIAFHGSQLVIKSKEGEGSCFSFALPLA